MAIARFEAPAAPAQPKAIPPRAAVLIVGETRSLFLPRVYELCRRNLIGGLARQGAAVDVFLRLDEASRRPRAARATGRSRRARRAVDNRTPAGFYSETDVTNLKPVQVSWFVAGKDEGDTESDAGLRKRHFIALAVSPSRSGPRATALDRPLWSQSVWKSTSVAPSSGEEPAPPRHRAGVASMAWRSTRRFSTDDNQKILISTQVPVVEPLPGLSGGFTVFIIAQLRVFILLLRAER